MRSAVLLLAAWSAAAADASVRVLILAGRNNHGWRATTPVLRESLEATGRFDVRVSEDPAGLTETALTPYHAVVLNYNGPRWGVQAEQALASFVHSGRGLVALHAASYAFSGLEGSATATCELASSNLHGRSTPR